GVRQLPDGLRLGAGLDPVRDHRGLHRHHVRVLALLGPLRGREVTMSSPVLSPKRFAIHAALLGAALLMLYPLGWMVGSSFKPEDQIFTDLSLLPRDPHLDHYVDGWSAGQADFGRYFLNSTLISLGAVIGNV